jgi:hypothetical protein
MIGIARITDLASNRIGIVPLCPTCGGSEDRFDALIRTYKKAPKLVVKDGGDITDDQLAALIEKQDAVEH